MKTQTQVALNAQVAEEATGCIGSGSYAEYARSKGYNFIEVLDWTSSAGDWQFIISKDGKEWKMLFQENNYPREGFSHSIDDAVYEGTGDEVLKELFEMYQ